DDFYLPSSQCPKVGLSSLPWPRGHIPDAFARRGCHDTNAPASLDWPLVLSTLHARVAAAEEARAPAVLVEGLLLFADHPGAAAVRDVCQRHVLLTALDSSAQQVLCHRKWSRAHLGKRSYREQGVCEEEYRVYWDHYVWPSWIAHSSMVPASTLCLDCLSPMHEAVEAILPLLSS
ncbi:MAG: hypothetical protein SGPRY_002226, partial [Prymnesium sp.]